MKKKKVIWHERVSVGGRPLSVLEVGDYKATIIDLRAHYEATTYKLVNGEYQFHKNFGRSKSEKALKKRIEALGIFTEYEQSDMVTVQPRKATLAVEARAAEHRCEIDTTSMWWHD